MTLDNLFETPATSTIYQAIYSHLWLEGNLSAFITALTDVIKAVISEKACQSVCVSAYLRFPLKNDHTAPFVPCGQELSGVVELDSGDDISWRQQNKNKGRKKEENS